MSMDQGGMGRNLVIRRIKLEFVLERSHNTQRGRSRSIRQSVDEYVIV